MLARKLVLRHADHVEIDCIEHARHGPEGGADGAAEHARDRRDHARRDLPMCGLACREPERVAAIEQDQASHSLRQGAGIQRGEDVEADCNADEACRQQARDVAPGDMRAIATRAAVTPAVSPIRVQAGIRTFKGIIRASNGMAAAAPKPVEPRSA